jgi:hypothetical protein
VVAGEAVVWVIPCQEPKAVAKKRQAAMAVAVHEFLEKQDKLES